MAGNRHGYKQVAPLGLKTENHFSGKEFNSKRLFLDSPGYTRLDFIHKLQVENEPIFEYDETLIDEMVRNASATPHIRQEAQKGADPLVLVGIALRGKAVAVRWEEIPIMKGKP